QRRDIVTSFNGKPIHEYEDLPLMVANTEVGSQVKVEILRDGKPKTMEVRIDELKEDSKLVAEKKNQKPDKIGVVVDVVPDEIQRAFSLAQNHGVMVMSVEPGSSAERAGVIPGDIIEEIGGSSVDGLTSYEHLISGLHGEKPALFLLRKKEGTRFAAIK